MLMADYLSLAQHLQHAATQYPDALALIDDWENYTFADLLATSCLLAERIPAARNALIDSGTSSHLARHAYACSLANRPFGRLTAPTKRRWPTIKPHRSIRFPP